MMSDLSYSSFFPTVNFNQLTPYFHYLDRFIPNPQKLYAKSYSTVAAAAFGAVYGLVGRVIYPQAGIIPLNYAVWFAIAYQIKQIVHLLESTFDQFLGIGTYLDELEEMDEYDLDLTDRIRCRCWQAVWMKNQCLQSIDEIVSQCLHIRPYQDIKPDNVQDASFLEMCRYRMWPIFRRTVLDTVSFAVAYRGCNVIGLILPARTAVPLLILIRSVVKDILLIPALHIYARICKQVVDEVEDDDPDAHPYRAKFLQYVLPSL